ncbi:MAG: nicotinate (nicotinamide) nucleotide adenylyltransferase [Phycisphaerae bacterium]
MKTDLVLFGGSFDPVHHGHLIVARAIAEQLGVKRITLVPAACSPHKTGRGPGKADAASGGPPHASAAHRLAMLRLATEGEAVFEICELEINRAGPSYTLDTLVELKAMHGHGAKLRWVIGADMLEDLPAWRRVEEVLAAADMVIAARPPWQERLSGIFASLENRIKPQWINKLRQSVLATPVIDISSTVIRERLAVGRSIRYLVPEAVRAYIGSQGLYGPPKKIQ